MALGPSQDAAALRKAMKGLGTDDKALCAIIPSRTNEELQMVRAAFAQEFGRNLIDDIKSETSGNYRKALVGLCLTRAEYDARCCNKAMKGAGTDEKALVETLVHRTPQELEAIKAAYLQMYGKTLEHDIKGDTSGVVEKLLLGIINNQRMEYPPDTMYLKQTVDKLYDAGQGRMGTDEKAFVETLTTLGPNFLKLLDLAYARYHGDSLYTAVEKEMSGCLARTLKALLTPHDEYYADCIFKACEGAGTDDDRLVRAVVSRRHMLNGINAVFVHKYGKSISHRISKECSGNYAKVMTAVTAMNYP